jgi:chitinase
VSSIVIGQILPGKLSRRAVVRATVLAGLPIVAGCISIRPPAPTPIDSSTGVPSSPIPTSVAELYPTAAPTVVPSPLPSVEPTATERPGPTPSPSQPPSTRHLVGYFPGYRHDYTAADVPADRLTHLIYAFANVTDTGECVLSSPKVDQTNLTALRALKQQSPQIRVTLSIGGAAQSKHFPIAAASAQSRQRFAQTAVQLVTQAGLDGIDVDWEYPRSAQEKDNYVALLAELRRQLGASTDGSNLLTIAAGPTAGSFSGIDWQAAQASLDWLNLMTYDYHGAWSKRTNFLAPLHAASDDPAPSNQRATYNAAATVSAYRGFGVPAAKLMLGVVFYGFGWQGVPDVNHGLFQANTGPAPGGRGQGVFDYRRLKAEYLGTYPRYWHAEAKSPWLYQPQAGVMISYDDPESLSAKAELVRAQGLGGMMLWELSMDDADHSLVKVMSTGLG